MKEAPTGCRAVIVGNGSSVDAMPPAFWRMPGWAYIGTNRCLAFEATQGLRWDAAIIRDRYACLWTDKQLAARYHDELWKPNPAFKVGPADRRVTHCDEFVRQVPGWQHESAYDHNRERGVMKNASVTIMALNWAWLQGFRELVLVGVDYQAGMAALVDPYTITARGNEKIYQKGQCSKGVARQFAEAVAAIESHGGSIVNLSPESLVTQVRRQSHENWIRMY